MADIALQRPVRVAIHASKLLPAVPGVTPRVTGVAPARGSQGTGFVVTVTGQGLDRVTSADFGPDVVTEVLSAGRTSTSVQIRLSVGTGARPGFRPFRLGTSISDWPADSAVGGVGFTVDAAYYSSRIGTLLAGPSAPPAAPATTSATSLATAPATVTANDLAGSADTGGPGDTDDPGVTGDDRRPGETSSTGGGTSLGAAESGSGQAAHPSPWGDDRAAVTVELVDPAPGSGGDALAAVPPTVLVAFSREVDWATVTPGSFTLTDQAGRSVGRTHVEPYPFMPAPASVARATLVVDEVDPAVVTGEGPLVLTLRVAGTGPSPVRDLAGVPVDGAGTGGNPPSDFVHTLTVIPAP
jgi:hypothetical protein